jgi:hypothetical protein
VPVIVAKAADQAFAREGARFPEVSNFLHGIQSNVWVLAEHVVQPRSTRLLGTDVEEVRPRVRHLMWLRCISARVDVLGDEKTMAHG